MVRLRPFKALRPKKEYARAVATLPYDVISTVEARDSAGDNPHSFFRVIRSEIEFPDSANPYGEEVYERASNNLNSLFANGTFIEEAVPSVYFYRLVMNGRAQIGLVACSSVEDYESGKIKIHEFTRPEKETDRTVHMITTKAHTEPVFLAYKSNQELKKITEKETSGEALYDFTASDGVRHTLWKVSDTQGVVAAFENLSCTYIADGHHRAASSKRCRDDFRGKNPNHSGLEEYNFFLTVLFPHDELKIMPYNRIIKKLPTSPAAILSAIGEVYEVTKGAAASPRNPGEVSFYLEGVWYGLAPKQGEVKPQNPVDALDVSILQNKVLQPIFGVNDPRTDKNIDFVGGIRGTEELEKLVNSGEAQCAFSMYPVSIEELFAVADSGLIMAPKSTWFEPKLRSGLFVHCL